MKKKFIVLEKVEQFIRQANELLGYPDSSGTLTYCNIPEIIELFNEENEVIDSYYEVEVSNQLDRLLDPEKWVEIDRIASEIPPYIEPEYVEPEPIDYTAQIEARKQELLLKLVAAIVEVNSIKEAAREIVGSDNVDFVAAVNQAEQIRQGSIYLINSLDTIEKAMAFDIREHTIQMMKNLFIQFIIQ